MYHGVPCGRNSPKKADAVLDEADDRRADENQQREAERNDQLRSECVTVRQHSEHVAEQDEEEQGKDERKIGLPAAAYVCFNMFATNS